MAYLAEQFGLADITGAYIAGVALCNTRCAEYIEKHIQVVSYMLLSPIFFASIGINMAIGSLNGRMLLLSGALLGAAVFSKIIGCGLGAKLCKFSNAESFQVGIGMVTRGEVSIIIANKGIQAGIMDANLFSCVILVVLVTVLVTPVLLKIVYAEKNKKGVDPKPKEKPV